MTAYRPHQRPYCRVRAFPGPEPERLWVVFHLKAMTSSLNVWMCVSACLSFSRTPLGLALSLPRANLSTMSDRQEARAEADHAQGVGDPAPKREDATDALRKAAEPRKG